MNKDPQPHRIIVVGGGAGGLELATKLGNKFGRRKKAEITLVDASLTHLWKPLLHEVAAGTLDSHEDDLAYMAQAHWRHFTFIWGRMDGLVRDKREINVAPTLDEKGEEIIPRRTFNYDTLIIAVGSTTDDFGIKGVREHCEFLDSREQADKFNQTLLKRYYAAQAQIEPLRKSQLHVAIAGAGATGIELAAELHDATRQLVDFGLDHIQPDRDIKLTIVEAADTILPALHTHLSDTAAKALRDLDIEIRTGERIVEANAEGFHTESGDFVPAELKVWAAGIKAPDFLQDIDGLETNRANQLVVRQTLQATRDENIFAFGDCAACSLADTSETVPPRAQAAHQQSSLLVKSMKRRLTGERVSLPIYKYVDYGSLVNLSRYSTVGNMRGNLLGKFSGSVMIGGLLARFVYLSLYKMHQAALHGFVRVGLITLANLLTRRSTPRMKLH